MLSVIPSQSNGITAIDRDGVRLSRLPRNGQPAQRCGPSGARNPAPERHHRQTIRIRWTTRLRPRAPDSTPVALAGRTAGSSVAPDGLPMVCHRLLHRESLRSPSQRTPRLFFDESSVSKQSSPDARTRKAGKHTNVHAASTSELKGGSLPSQPAGLCRGERAQRHRAMRNGRHNFLRCCVESWDRRRFSA